MFFFFGCLEWFNFRVGLRSTLAPPLQVLEQSREFQNDAALKGYDETRYDLGNGRCGEGGGAGGCNRGVECVCVRVYGESGAGCAAAGRRYHCGVRARRRGTGISIVGHSLGTDALSFNGSQISRELTILRGRAPPRALRLDMIVFNAVNDTNLTIGVPTTGTERLRQKEFWCRRLCRLATKGTSTFPAAVQSPTPPHHLLVAITPGSPMMVAGQSSLRTSVGAPRGEVCTIYGVKPGTGVPRPRSHRYAYPRIRVSTVGVRGSDAFDLRGVTD